MLGRSSNVERSSPGVTWDIATPDRGQTPRSSTNRDGRVTGWSTTSDRAQSRGPCAPNPGRQKLVIRRGYRGWLRLVGPQNLTARGVETAHTHHIGCLQAPSDGPPARLKHGRVVARFRGMVMPLTRTIEANPRSHTVTLGDADLPIGGHPQSRPTTRFGAVSAVDERTNAGRHWAERVMSLVVPDEILGQRTTRCIGEG
jgi:hypothetical protein